MVFYKIMPVILVLLVMGFHLQLSMAIIHTKSSDNEGLNKVNRALNEVLADLKSKSTPCRCPGAPGVPTHLPLTAQTPKEKLLAYLKMITGSFTISGQRNYFHLDARDQALDNIKEITGEYPGLSSSWLWTNGKDMWKYTDTLTAEWNNGSLISLVVRQCSPISSKCHTFGDLSRSEWSRLMTDGSILNQKWKSGLDSVVPYLKKLEERGVTTIVNMLCEINDPKQWWGGVTRDKGSVKLYKMTHDYLTNHHGLKSLVWMWTVLDGWKTVEQLRQYWPGNEYVDIAALYLSSKEEPTYSEYQGMLEIAGEKPIVIGHMLIPPSPELFKKQPNWVAFIRRHETISSSFYKNVNATYHHRRILNQNQINFERL